MADPNDPAIDSNAPPDEADVTLPVSDKTAAPGSDSGNRPEIRMNTEKSFGDYELLDEIARGGMGAVYKAKHTALNRTVALKMILSGRFAAAKDVRRFRQEAEAAANLDHSAIVPIYDVGEHEGRHFFSMKFIESGSLADKLPELRKDRETVVRLIADIANAEFCIVISSRRTFCWMSMAVRWFPILVWPNRSKATAHSPTPAPSSILPLTCHPNRPPPKRRSPRRPTSTRSAPLSTKR